MTGNMLMMPLLIAVAAIGIGILGSRGRPYWNRAAIAILVAVAMTVFGASAGTLDDPTGDGLITRAIRTATNDGAAAALWGIGVLLVGYSLIIILLVTGVRADQAQKAASGRD